MPCPPSPLARAARLLLACGLLATGLLAAGPALATTYYVDIATGVDDAAQDGLTAATAWKTVTYACSRTNDGGVHEIRVAAGEYTVAAGEAMPIRLPINVSLKGAGSDLTIFRNSAGTQLGTIRWAVRAGQTITSAPTMSDFSIVHDKVGGLPLGAGLVLELTDAVAAPRLTNLVITNAGTGISMLADAYNATTTMGTVVDRCRITGSVWGILATAYTTSGNRSQMNPVISNTISAQSISDGMVFETTASWDISSGQRAAATSDPVITHCTITDSLGSAILLDNSNGYISYKSGNIQPAITNCILAGNGDYAVSESYTGSTEPSPFNNNIIGNNSTALYLDEGITELLTLAGVPGTGNQDATPLFVRGIVPTYHLRADSPGVEDALTTVVTLDIDSQTRPINSDGAGLSLPEIGADEVSNCAVTAVISPATPAPYCGPEGPILFSATGSGPTTGFTCSGVTYKWYADGVEVGTDETYLADPQQTTTYTVVVTCPDQPWCQDAAEATVTVWRVPDVDATVGAGPAGSYAACVAHDAADVSIPLQGSATSTQFGSTLSGTLWTTTAGVLAGETSLDALLTVVNNDANQLVQVTLTATDSNNCVTASSAIVNVWRGPEALPMAPLVTCQTPDQPQTIIPITGTADVPLGSTIAEWSWRSSVGSFDNPRAQNPNLTLINLPLTRTATLTLTVTDDHGCTHEAQTTVTLNQSPNGASAGGPYQQAEDVSGTTSFAMCASATSGAGNTFEWTTDIGVFLESGTTTATGQCVTLLITNTGSDQVANPSVTVTSANGCDSTVATQASVRTGAARPPNDVGGTFRIDKLSPSGALLSWQNAPLDATHDLARSYDVWESLERRPIARTWAQRAGATAIPAGSGTTQFTDAALTDFAGPDLIFLKIVSENPGGFSCTDPATELPDCP